MIAIGEGSALPNVRLLSSGLQRSTPAVRSASLPRHALPQPVGLGADLLPFHLTQPNPRLLLPHSQRTGCGDGHVALGDQRLGTGPGSRHSDASSPCGRERCLGRGQGAAGRHWSTALALPASGQLAYATADTLDLTGGTLEFWIALRASGQDRQYKTDQTLFSYRAPDGDYLQIVQDGAQGVLYAGGATNGQWQSAWSNARELCPDRSR